ncbi:MAG: methyltransferase domain-containing protein [Myxococcota bacterium]
MHYDQWAARYDEDTQRFGWCAPQRVLEAVLERLVPQPALRVLDLGVGTGQCSTPFLRVGASVVGVDAAPAMLEQARKRGTFAQLVELKLGEHSLGEALGPNATFDVVVACGVLHFVSDLEDLFTELRGLVEDEGLLSLTTIPPQPRAFGPSTRLRSPEVVASGLTSAGFSVQHQDPFVAYYDRADRDDPVRYTLTVASA